MIIPQNLIIDPSDEYTKQGANLLWCLECTGDLLSYINPLSNNLLIDDLEDGYGSKGAPISGQVWEKGMLSQPYIEDVPPLVSITRANETLYIYRGGIVASVMDSGEYVVALFG